MLMTFVIFYELFYKIALLIISSISRDHPLGMKIIIDQYLSSSIERSIVMRTVKV